MDLASIAGELLTARKKRSYVEPPSGRDSDFSIHDGYAVGALLHANALGSGYTQRGVKLGFTNETVWNALGLDSPFWSPIYAETVTDRHELSLDPFVEPRLEPEIVVGLGSALGHGAGRDDVAAAIAWAAVGFEIVQSHYRNWEMQPADAIADGGLHGILVVGEHHAVGASPAEALAAVEVALMHDDRTVASGTGANPLGGPVAAVTWLLRLPGVDEIPAGSVITTGSLTPAFPLAAGETWQVSTAGARPLGDLRLTLAAAAR